MKREVGECFLLNITYQIHEGEGGMSVKSKSIQATNQSAYEQSNVKNSRHTAKKQKQSFFAGNILKNDQQMQMAQKRAEAQKESVRTLARQYQKDLKFAKQKDDILSEQEGYMETIKNSNSMLHDLEHDKDNLDEEFQINENKKSDADLIDKAERVRDGSGETFTDKEKNRILKLYDYANQVQQISDNIKTYKNAITKSESGIMSDNLSLMEYQKVQQSDMGMEKSKKKAQEILDAFSSDAIQSMMKQVKETTDDKEKETTEKALEKEAKDTTTQPAATKEQEKENVQDKQNKKDAVLTKALVKQDIQSDTIQVQIKTLVKKENLSLDILKGLEVDEKI